MIHRDYFRRAGWCGWAIIALLLVLVPVACQISQAQAPDTTRADGPMQPEDIRCANGWCVVRQDTMKSLLAGLQKLDEHASQLRWMCGWRER
jgi:hypothetical protein